MPLFELHCANSSCPDAHRVSEHYMPSYHTPDPLCGTCGQRLLRGSVYRFNAGWAHGLGYYGNKTAHGERSDVQRVWSKEKNGFITISNRQEQLDYVRREKLTDPADLPSTARLSSDGTKLITDNRSEI